MLVIFGANIVTSPEDIGESDSILEQDLCILKGGTSLTEIVQGLVDLMDDEVRNKYKFIISLWL